MSQVNKSTHEGKNHRRRKRDSGQIPSVRKRPSKALRLEVSESLEGYPEPGNLCARCAALDLDEIFSTRINKGLGEFVMELEDHIDQLKGSSCPFCVLLSGIIPSKFDDDNSSVDGQCHVRAFSANRVFAGPNWKIFLDGDSTILGVVMISQNDALSGKGDAMSKISRSLEETGYIGIARDSPLPKSLGLRRICSENFDDEFIKNCISYCLDHHGQACNPPRNLSEKTSPSMVNFRVIDCLSRHIIQAPSDCIYVALSYLWGTKSSKPPISMSEKDEPRLPEDCPAGIIDSIYVVQRLGYRYLWVDRYCIDQSDLNDKEEQVSHMDLIYIGAHITLIAAAGDGPDYGLPGVNNRCRTKQPNTCIDSKVLISSLSHPNWSIAQSTWATRGWTYQEGILSKRRVIFTDQQVIFECNTMSCTESLWWPLDAIHRKSKQQVREMRAGIPASFFTHEMLGSSPTDIISHLSDFSQRDLTYQSDTLSAFQGVFQIFARADLPVHHLVGVPVLPPTTHLRNQKTTDELHEPRDTINSFLQGLSWFHKKPGQRILEFPSWSWAGWKGKLEDYFFWGMFSLFRTNSDSTQIQFLWLEDDEGNLLRFPCDHAEIPNFLSATHASIRFIHITATTVECELVYIKVAEDLNEDEHQMKYSPDQDGYYIKLALSNRPGETYIFAPAYLDGPPAPLIGTPLFGIMYSDVEAAIEQGEEQYFLLVQQLDSYAERVGCFALHEGYVQHKDEGLWVGMAKWNFDGQWICNARKRTIRLG